MIIWFHHLIGIHSLLGRLVDSLSTFKMFSELLIVLNTIIIILPRRGGVMFSGGFVTPKDVNQHLRWISLDLTE